MAPWSNTLFSLTCIVLGILICLAQSQNYTSSGTLGARIGAESSLKDVSAAAINITSKTSTTSEQMIDEHTCEETVSVFTDMPSSHQANCRPHSLYYRMETRDGTECPFVGTFYEGSTLRLSWTHSGDHPKYSSEYSTEGTVSIQRFPTCLIPKEHEDKFGGGSTITIPVVRIWTTEHYYITTIVTVSHYDDESLSLTTNQIIPSTPTTTQWDIDLKRQRIFTQAVLNLDDPIISKQYVNEGIVQIVVRDTNRLENTKCQQVPLLLCPTVRIMEEFIGWEQVLSRNHTVTVYTTPVADGVTNIAEPTLSMPSVPFISNIPDSKQPSQRPQASSPNQPKPKEPPSFTNTNILSPASTHLTTTPLNPHITLPNGEHLSSGSKTTYKGHTITFTIPTPGSPISITIDGIEVLDFLPVGLTFTENSPEGNSFPHTWAIRLPNGEYMLLSFSNSPLGQSISVTPDGKGIVIKENNEPARTLSLGIPVSSIAFSQTKVHMVQNGVTKDVIPGTGTSTPIPTPTIGIVVLPNGRTMHVTMTGEPSGGATTRVELFEGKATHRKLFNWNLIALAVALVSISSVVT